MKTRQEKALELRDLVTKINAIVAELEEDDCTVAFNGKMVYARRKQVIHGLIDKVEVERKYNL